MRQRQPEPIVTSQALGAPRRTRQPRSDGMRAIDGHVGARVRLQRTIKGMSQSALGAAVGVTFQQMQKYESGANRIGASKLWALAEVLDVPISFFFDELIARRGASTAAAGLAEARELDNRETLSLARAFNKIPQPDRRKSLLALTRSLAGESEEG